MVAKIEIDDKVVEVEKDAPHYSVSQINMATRCLLQYYYRYVKGIKRLGSAAMHLGTAFHFAAETNYAQKVESKKDLKLTVVLDAYNDKFDNPDQEIDWADDDPASIKDTGYKLTELYYNKAAIVTQPVMVEKRMFVDLPGVDRPLLGFIDLVDDKSFIRDSKTKGKTPPENIAANSLQLSAYAMGYRAITGKKEKGVGLDFCIKTKEPKYIEIHEKTRPDWQLTRDLETIINVAKVINAGTFYPCDPDAWNCSEKWCGYYKECREKGKK